MGVENNHFLIFDYMKIELDSIIPIHNVFHFNELNSNTINNMCRLISIVTGHTSFPDWTYIPPMKHTHQGMVTIRVSGRTEFKFSMGNWFYPSVQGHRRMIMSISDKRFKEIYRLNEERNCYEKSMAGN